MAKAIDVTPKEVDIEFTLREAMDTVLEGILNNSVTISVNEASHVIRSGGGRFISDINLENNTAKLFMYDMGYIGKIKQLKSKLND